MKPLMGMLAASALLAGCATAPANLGGTDNFLMTAGFKQVPRDSPVFAATVHMVTPHKFGHHTTAGVTTYYYVDPTICGCVYTGTAQDWASYRQLVADKMHMEANMFLETVDMPSDAGSG